MELFPFHNKIINGASIFIEKRVFRFLDRTIFFQKILFMASRCTYYLTKCGSTSLCDQNCGVQPADGQTDTRQTDKSLKTAGPKILSNDIFYFRTVIIGGPILEPPFKTSA